MDAMKDWEKSTAAYLAKDEAYKQAIAVSRGIDALRDFACIVAVVVGLLVFWDRSWHALVVIALAILAFRLVTYAFHYAWRVRELARIEKLDGGDL